MAQEKVESTRSKENAYKIIQKDVPVIQSKDLDFLLLLLTAATFLPPTNWSVRHSHYHTVTLPALRPSLGLKPSHRTSNQSGSDGNLLRFGYRLAFSKQTAAQASGAEVDRHLRVQRAT